MASTPQDSTGVEGNVTQGNSAATFYAMEDNPAHICSASLSPRNKGRKRRRAYSGGIQGNVANTRGPKAAGVIPRAKRKRDQKAGSRDANPSSPEDKSDKTIQEGSDREVEPSMFSGVLVQNFANDIHFSLKGQGMIQP
jgi:hypothetical protein